MIDRYPNDFPMPGALVHLPPPESRLYSHESEYAVLGAMIRQPDLIEELGSTLERDDFHHPACAEVYEIIQACQRRGTPVDVVTLYEARPLLADGQNTLQVVTTLVDNTPSVANAATYAREVKRRSVARRVLLASESIIEALRGGEDLDAVFAKGQQAWLALEAEGTDKASSYRFVRDVLPQVIDTVDKRFNREAVVGFDTGLPSLDDFIPGLGAGHMVVIAGAPGSGKTTLGLGIAERIALHHKAPSLVFTFEMTDEELATRSIASVGGVQLKHLSEGHSMSDQDWPAMTAAVNRLIDAPLILCDDASLRMRDVRQVCRTVQRQHGLGAVTLDYLGLVPGEGSSSAYDRVTEISKAMKRLAKELRVPLIVLAQLNRAPAGRANKRPTKSDLRDSGQIEADADVVILVHRDPESEAGKAGVTELIVDKNRHGPTGIARVQHQGAFHRFVELLAGYHFDEED